MVRTEYRRRSNTNEQKELEMKKIIIMAIFSLAFFCGCKEEVKMEGPCERCGVHTRYLSMTSDLCPDCVIPAGREKYKNRGKINFNDFLTWGLVALGCLGGTAYIKSKIGSNNSDDD